MGIVNKEEYKCDRGWAEQEFASLDFGDRRLVRRAIKVFEDLSSRPQVPINHASGDWAATKAAYRLFSNESVTPEELLSAHIEQTKKRLSGEEVLLAVQDTTYLDYSNHEKCKGLGYVGKEGVKGVVLHSTLAITPLGLPLGLLRQQKYTRNEIKRQSGQGCRKHPIEEKESYRWIESLRDTAKLAVGAKQVVSICDREGDIYEFLLEADRLKTHYVVRSSTPRSLIDTGDVVTAVEQEPFACILEVTIPSREGRTGRTAELEVRFVQVTLKPPLRHIPARSMELSPLSVWVVLAREINTPANIIPLEWMLLTNVEVGTSEDAIERLQWYRIRWQIEIYHKILKSGCKIEDCRLQTIEALFIYLTMFGIIAWRIYWLTHISRTLPEAPARVVLAKTELIALGMLAGRKNKRPLEIKTAMQAVIEIAKLGGFLARRHDGYPGPTVIWRGFQRLSDAAEMYEIMAPQTCG